MLKAIDIVGLSWLTFLFSVAGRSGTEPLEWQTRVVVPILKKGDWRVCSNYQCIKRFTPGCQKGSFGKLSNLGFRRNIAVSVLVVEQQISFLPLHPCLQGLGSLPNQSTCVLWTWKRPMTRSPGAYCGGYCRCIGYRALYFTLLSCPCLTKVRAV